MSFKFEKLTIWQKSMNFGEYFLNYLKISQKMNPLI
jgi:hypothetical protein